MLTWVGMLTSKVSAYLQNGIDSCSAIIFHNRFYCRVATGDPGTWIIHSKLTKTYECYYFSEGRLLTLFLRYWADSLLVRLVRCFSLQGNLSELLGLSSSRISNLAVLDGIRSLSMLWVIFGHTYFFVENVQPFRK